MKVVILAGGLGTRIAEETTVKPKPMVEIGGRPILWHIMKIYSHFGFNDFIICLGYKGYIIKEYFANYFLHMSDVTLHLAENRMDVHRETAEPWRVTLINTGEDTQTGGRIKRILPFVRDDPFFALTYGDGVADIDIAAEIDFHKAHGRKATVAAVRPATRFGALSIQGHHVVSFQEKPESDGSWINGGFFLL
jgi:glucose-1-phosphate cytidylyltransferase